MLLRLGLIPILAAATSALPPTPAMAAPLRLTPGGPAVSSAPTGGASAKSATTGGAAAPKRPGTPRQQVGRISRRPVRLLGNAIRVRIACPVSTTGVLSLRIRKRRNRWLRLGVEAFGCVGGRPEIAKVRVSPLNERSLRRRGRVLIHARAVVNDPQGGAEVTMERFRLLAG